MRLKWAALAGPLAWASLGAGWAQTPSARALSPENGSLSGAYDALSDALQDARLAAFARASWEIEAPRFSPLTNDEVVLGKHPFPAFSSRDLRLVSRALSDARRAAKRGSTCDRALTRYFVPSLADLVDRYVVEGPGAVVFDGRSSTLIPPGYKRTVAQIFRATDNRPGAGAGAFVLAGAGIGRPVTYLGPYFFDPAMPLTGNEQRMLMLTHEAVHHFGGLGDAEFGGSRELTRLLIDKCYPAGRGRLGGIESTTGL